MFEDTRTKTIAEREDEYRARGRKRVISPERLDPFLVGTVFFSTFFQCSFLCRRFITISNRLKIIMSDKN